MQGPLTPTEQDGRQALGNIIDALNEVLAQMGPVTKRCVGAGLQKDANTVHQILTAYGQLTQPKSEEQK